MKEYEDQEEKKYIYQTCVLFFQELDFGDKEVFHILITGSLKIQSYTRIHIVTFLDRWNEYVCDCSDLAQLCYSTQ